MPSSPWDPEGVETVLHEDGTLADPSATEGLALKETYKALVATRTLDLVLGRLGLPMWASCAGEEAPAVAVGRLLTSKDVLFPTARDLGVWVGAGIDLGQVLAAAIEHRRTVGLQPGGALQAFTERGLQPPMRTLGLHLALASGVARAQSLAGGGGVTVALCGEGQSTLGSFHEVLALASTGGLPLVVVCKSQVWPEGAPAEAGLVGDSVSERARTFGVWVRRVDGADPVGVHVALRRAIDRARGGHGPALVETVVTQLLHDPPAHRDPIERLRRHLDRLGLWTPTFQDVLEAETRARLEKATRAAEETSA